jgi:class 3 adenylate cyclase
LARHDEILRDAVEKRGGHVVKTTGDGLFAAFTAAHEGISAAAAAQRDLTREAWSTPQPLRVRMGVHRGIAEIRDADYYGTAVNRAARIAAAHGGQIVASGTAVDLASDDLDASIVVQPLGEHRLRDLERPERIVQITTDGLDAIFPPCTVWTRCPATCPCRETPSSVDIETCERSRRCSAKARW